MGEAEHILNLYAGYYAVAGPGGPRRLRVVYDDGRKAEGYAVKYVDGVYLHDRYGHPHYMIPERISRIEHSNAKWRAGTPLYERP